MGNAKKIKVLHVITRADIGGISSLLYNYYSHMQHGNIVFHVISIETSYTQRYQKIFEDLGIRVFFMPAKIGKRLLYLWTLIRREKYPVVHAHVELVSAVYLTIAKLAGVKARIAHTHLAIDNKGLKNRILKLLLNAIATDRVGCSKKAIKKLFGSVYMNDATVISNAIDPTRYRFDNSLRQSIRCDLQVENKYVVGFVGRLTPLKNIPYLLQIFKALKDKKEDVVLLLIGEGELRGEIESQVNELGLIQEVVLLDGRTDVNQLLTAMDVLLLPSFSEGFGLVLLEAQAAALKCIASLGRVSEETNISDYIHYEAIEKPATAWCNLILERCIDYKRVNMEDDIGKHRHDVRIEANRLIDFYNKAVVKN